MSRSRDQIRGIDGYENYFLLSKKFGANLALRAIIERETVCRRVSRGTRIVPAVPAQDERLEEVFEWVCDEPLLAEAK